MALRSLFFRHLLSSSKANPPSQFKGSSNPSQLTSSVKGGDILNSSKWRGVIESQSEGERESEEDGVMSLLTDVSASGRQMRKFHWKSKERDTHSQLFHVTRVLTFRHAFLLDFDCRKFYSPLSLREIDHV